MRVGMMMRDTEYRDAMIEMMSGFDKDIFIEVAGEGGVSRESVILTDIMPEEIESGSLEKIRHRTVFLSPVPDCSKKNAVNPGSSIPSSGNGSCSVVFKYSSLLEIMAEISYVYSAWTGNTGSISPSTRVIAVTGEEDSLSSDRCRSLAKQIIYRRGGSVLIMPLGYINDYRPPAADGRGRFRRLMYMIDEGKDYLPECYTYTDSYGISYLDLPAGINPLTALTTDYLTRLITSLCSHFETVILDAGTCYSSRNLKLMHSADNILFFGSERRIEDISQFVGAGNAEKVLRIDISDASAEALCIDDFVKEMYGRTQQEKHDTEIQGRDRRARQRNQEMDN